jgi:hypothetical protein
LPAEDDAEEDCNDPTGPKCKLTRIKLAREAKENRISLYTYSLNFLRGSSRDGSVQRTVAPNPATGQSTTIDVR